MKHGFTLLEVMIALIIFSITSVAALQIATNSLVNQRIIEEKMIAGWVVDNQIALHYLLSTEQRSQQSEGKTQMCNKYWYWRSVPLATENPLLQSIKIEVSLSANFESVIQERQVWFSNTQI